MSDLRTAIKDVSKAKDDANAPCEKIIGVCHEVDFVAADLCVIILGDEQEQRRAFVDYLTEFERKSTNTNHSTNDQRK